MKLARLSVLKSRHMQAFLEAHPEDAVKPKYHWATHIGEAMAMLRMVVGQFVIERLHHSNKAAAATLEIPLG